MLRGMADNDYHILRQRMRIQTETFANQPFDPVTLMGACNLALGDNKPKTRAVDAGYATPQNSEVAVATFPFRGVEYGVEFAGLRQPGRFGKKRSHAVNALYGQTVTALGTATFQNQTTIFGGHAGTEAVGALALEIAGLESSF